MFGHAWVSSQCQLCVHAKSEQTVTFSHASLKGVPL